MADKVKCQAICEDYERPKYKASMQRITIPSDKKCSKSAVEKVGHLDLCRVHARLAKEGFVDKDGSVLAKYLRDNARDYPHKFMPWFKWLKGE